MVTKHKINDREFVDAKDFDEVLKALESITRKCRLAALPFMHDEIKADYDVIDKFGGDNDLKEREPKFYGDVPL